MTEMPREIPGSLVSLAPRNDDGGISIGPSGARRRLSRTPERLADLVSDRRPARSDILQLTFTQGRKTSPQACARAKSERSREDSALSEFIDIL
jgi:hypothetical protein